MAQQAEHEGTIKLGPSLLKHLKTFLSDAVPTAEPGAHERQAPLPKNDRTDDGTLQTLTSYVSSPAADIEEPPDSLDLSKTLSNYYISSSHNTYLTGNQLYSDSSVDGYINVLRRGCRCVEIDIWSGKAADESSSSDDDERAGLRERLGFSKRRSKKKGEPEADTPANAESLRERGANKLKSLHKKDFNTAPAKDASDKPEMPDPWAANTKARTEPRVLHGYTLTKEVQFRHVCEAIRDNAFVASDLPLIVSLEVHASLEQQALMVEIIKEVWSDYLVKPPSPGEDIKALPPLDQLRKKILIKVKYSPPESAKKNEEQDLAGSASDDDESAETGDPKKPAKKKKILDELSQLGIYIRGYSFKSFDQPEAQVPTHIFSLSENVITEAVEEQPTSLMAHNRDYLMRVYPKGLRFSSSNLEPVPMWRHGVQIVALNWQRHDQATILNEAMFAGTGGWVLKPPSHRSDDKLVPDKSLGQTETTNPQPAAAAPPSSTDSSNPANPLVPAISHPSSIPPAAASKLLNLTVTVYAGQSLPLPPEMTSRHQFRPFLKIILHTDLPEDASSTALTRSPIRNSKDSNAEPKERQSSAREYATSLLHRGRGALSGKDHGASSSTTKPSAVGNDPSPKQPNGKGKGKATSKSQHKARTTPSRGGDPDWNAQVLHFEDVAIEEPELVFVRFKLVHDIEMGRDDVAGWACVRLVRLRQGLRMLRVRNCEGVEGQGRVLLNVEWSIRESAKAGETASLPLR